MEPPDNPTFTRVAAEHRPFIRRALAQLGIRAADLDDVEQEVLHAIQRGLPTFDPSLSATPQTALRGWIFGICERQAASHRRSEAQREEVLCSATDHVEYHPDDIPNPEARLIERERSTALHNLLAALRPHRRAVVIGYELEELPMILVAKQLGVPINTAWNHLRLARADLRTAWRQRMGGGIKKP